jgi:hypothetical protein
VPIAAKPLADLKVELIDLVDDFGGPHAEKSKILHGIAWEGAGVKRRAITRRHGFERVLARGATIAAHLIGAAADREHSAYRAVATAEQEVKCASDESFHFSEFKKLFLNSLLAKHPLT